MNDNEAFADQIFVEATFEENYFSHLPKAFSLDEAQAVWSDLAKFRHFSKKWEIFGRKLFRKGTLKMLESRWRIIYWNWTLCQKQISAKCTSATMK